MRIWAAVILAFMGCGPTRFATFNIANGAGFTSQQHRDTQKSMVIRSDADIVALQEVDMFASRSGMIDTARATVGSQYHIEFAQTIDFEQDPYFTTDKGLYGIAIASREPILPIKNVVLPGSVGYLKFVAQIVQIGPYRVINTHLHWGDPDIRKAQLEAIAGLVEPNTVLLGDFNQLDVDILQLASPQGMIDMIRTNRLFGDSGSMFDVDASDHSLVFAEVY